MTDETPGWSDAQRERSRLLAMQLGTLPAGSPQRAAVRDELVVLHLPLVRYLARRYYTPGVPMEDIVQVGTVGLIDAVDRFDATRGGSLATFAAATVLGHIKHYFRDSTWAVHVPRQIRERSRLVGRRIDELTARNGRTPTVAEIAADLDLSQADVLDALEAGHAIAADPLDPTADDTGARYGAVETAFERIENRETVRALLADLPEHERRILTLRFTDQLSQARIAEQLGISQMQVSRILARTLARLRAELDPHP